MKKGIPCNTIKRIRYCEAVEASSDYINFSQNCIINRVNVTWIKEVCRKIYTNYIYKPIPGVISRLDYLKRRVFINHRWYSKINHEFLSRKARSYNCKYSRMYENKIISKYINGFINK